MTTTSSASSFGDAGSLLAASQQLAAVVERLAESTFAVIGRHRRAIGTATHWRVGVVVSAAHVFRRTPAAITLVGAEGREVEATLAGIDSSTDLAAFRIGADVGAPSGDAEAEPVRAGHFVVAVGRSSRGEPTASQGIVNRVGGAWQSWLGGRIDRLIRLDGGLEHGLSGAPVADASGAVLGIGTAALSRSHGIVIPRSTVARVVEALVAEGRIARAWLGIGAQPVDLPGRAGSRGLLVTSLAANAPAHAAGLLVGDILTSIAGSKVEALADLRSALDSHVGERVTARIVRGGVEQDVDVTIGEWPSRPCC